jgi:iron donor protein CyaY
MPRSRASDTLLWKSVAIQKEFDAVAMNVVQCFGEIPKKNQKSTICAELINLPLMCGSAAFHCSERRRASQTAMLEKCDARCGPVVGALSNRVSVPGACYTGGHMDELEFRRTADGALDALKRHLIEREEDEAAGFEVEEQNGVLNVVFDEPPGKFVITPNTPVRQIWISALSTSFKLDWDAKASAFVLHRTGEHMMPLVDRLIHERAEG